MAELFSTYVQPRLAVKPLLAGAAMMIPAALVCLCLLAVFPPFYAFVEVIAGAIVWALAMAVVFLRPGRVALGFAIFGAMLVGTGIITYATGSYTCEYVGPPSGPVDRFLQALTGKTQPPPFGFGRE